MNRAFDQRARDRADDASQLEIEAVRGRILVEESRELVVVLDDERRVLAASRRARESLEGVREGEALPPNLLAGRHAFTIPYHVDGRNEVLLYLRDVGDLAAYEELRAGFTASVSHELRTPLARLLALLETAELPDADLDRLIEQARAEVGQIGELIDDVLFLSELESGREVVALGTTRALDILREVAASVADAAERAGVAVQVEGDDLELPLRPRMIRVVGQNLAENAVRYAGPGATLLLSLRREGDAVELAAADDGVGVSDEDLPRLFERFYRADRARASRGTGLGLAIVKHVVTSAGGTVEADGARGNGLIVRCTFPSDTV
jgi:two-component system phosphate regulon sensor histidine kinase PhoR